jgi:hypothetical protein
VRLAGQASVAADQERIEELPVSVQDALGELAGAAKDGLLAPASASGSVSCTS